MTPSVARGVLRRVVGSVVALLLGVWVLAACDPVAGTALAGTVVASNGAGVSGVTVSVFDDASESLVAEVVTGLGGGYSVPSSLLPDGQYRVRASGTWFGPGATDWASAATVPVSGGSSLPVDVTIPDAAVFNGRVVDNAADLNPVAGMVVGAFDASGDPIAVATTAADGTYGFAVAGSAPFTLRLYQNPPGLFAVLGGAAPQQITPVPGSTTALNDLTVLSPVAVGAGTGHSCSLLNDGSVSCWGANNFGQLGDSTNTESHVPVSVAGVVNATAIAVGGRHTCALLGGGSILCWGSDSAGQLGDGGTTDSNVPVPVSGITDAVAIAAGEFHTCALRSGGTISCWGAGINGQLGNGGNVNSNVPVTVSGVSGVTAIAAGGFETCALSGATISCWGAGADGELGNGTNANSNVPVTVSGITDAAAVTVGGRHACALRSGGTASCWGKNVNGQLGNGTNTDSNVPVTVSGVSGATALAAGGSHSCALGPTGEVSCWGYNVNGQLGDGGTTDSNVPVPVTGLGGVTAVAGGGMFHTCALTASGTVSCWGSNDYGQLGDGSVVASSTPTVVSGLPLAAQVLAAG